MVNVLVSLKAGEAFTVTNHTVQEIVAVKEGVTVKQTPPAVIVITFTWGLYVIKYVSMDDPMTTRLSVYVKAVTQGIAVMYPAMIMDSVLMVHANVTKHGGVSSLLARILFS